MQELYAEIEKFKGITDTVSITDIQRMIGNYYIEKEKQIIIESAIHGANFDKSPFKNAQDYYDFTFGDSNQAGI